MNETLFLLLGAVSTFANRAAEAVKAALKSRSPNMPPETVSMLALFVSLVAGLFGALLLNLNLLTLFPANPYTAQIPPLFGVLLTGCLASLGSEAIHFLLDLLQAGRDNLSSTTAKATVTVETEGGGGAASASVTPTPAAPASASAPTAPPYTGNLPRDRR